ncbi:CWC16 protein [Auriculariales sp. MPI-PUGE-AT-0066]|nr:CWC16 protein [Auriculariales sp. MPI-PUGE-AT-0066]
MSERKVLNKYYPPDFDPSKIPRRRGTKNKQQVVRLMAPFSMRCNSCGEYVYKGKKFNARKETVDGEDYYGIKIFRSISSGIPLCSSEITFKTDPKNTDYAAEHGASRNFEPWRDTGDSAVAEADRLEALEAEENNPMATLENRTMDSKREMAIMDALQDARARNARHERLVRGVAAEGIDGANPDDIMDKLLGLEEVDSEDEDALRLRLEEERMKSWFGRCSRSNGDAPDLQSLLLKTVTSSSSSSKPSASTSAPSAKKAKLAGGAGAAALGIKVVKKKKPVIAAS